MNNHKVTKIIITVLIILFTCIPIAIFLIYPSYDTFFNILSEINPYRISKDTSLSLFTKISPPRDLFDEKILGAQNIEETLNNVKITEKILEDTNTELEISNVNILGKIVQGEDANSMNKGFWHFPTSPYPGDLGNVVIIAHRFQYVPPAKNTFFNLDKVKIGDEIKIRQDGGEYTYFVTNIDIVDPRNISVIQNKDDYRLTLITCTPLWTSDQRLVITAKLDKLYKKV